MGNPICIIGTGGFAREVMCLITDLGRKQDIICFMEPDDIWEKNWKEKTIMNKPVWPQSYFEAQKHCAVIGVGNSRIREKVMTQLPKNASYETLIHPTAVVSEWVKIGEGTVICAGCILTCNITLGKQAHLNLHTTIGHDCVIGDFFTTAPGVNISGICQIGNHVYFGTSSAIRQEITICDNVTIGMGGIVVKNIEEPGVYVGMPVKKMK